MSGNLERRRMVKFMPADFKLTETRQPPLKDSYDEWLARLICYAFSVPASAFVSQVNRATSETLRMQATQEGLVPLKAWVKSALDSVVQVYLKQPDLEFVWVGDDAVDPLEQAQTLNILVTAGIKTREEARADLGLAAEPKGAGLGKYSENHDERGRFATAGNAASSGGGPPATPVAYPGDYHDQVLKDELDQYLKTGARCLSEVRIQFDNTTARLDIMCVGRSGMLMGVDMKTGGDPTLTPEQQFVYSHAIVGAGVISPDSKVNLLSLPVNAPLPAFPIFIVWIPGPGELKRYLWPKLDPF